MAADNFLKIDGIEGESIDDAHKGEIEIQSFSFGLTQAGSMSSGTGGGVGRSSFQDFHFTMNMNKASVKLAAACANGKHVKSCILTCRKAGEKPLEYYKVTFTDVLISSYQTGGGGGSELPMDQISFNFSKIQWDYTPQKADGSKDSTITNTYDLKLNKLT